MKHWKKLTALGLALALALSLTACGGKQAETAAPETEKKPGVTLNLGSYSLYAEYVIGLNGSYVIADYDSSKAETGKLYVKQGNISLF